MKITKAGQIDQDVIGNEGTDVFICASGYEERAKYAASFLAKHERTYRVVLPFKEHKELSRAENDKFFAMAGFNYLPELDNGNWMGAFEQFTSVISPLILGQKTIDITLDYSCMTRAWFGAFVYFIFNGEFDVDCVNVNFVYTPAKFTEPSAPSPNAVAGPLQGFSSLRPVDKPVALVIGLGYEKVRAAGITEYIDPARTVLFYTNPAIDEQFTHRVLENNKALLDSVGRSNIIQHPLRDLDTTAALLHDVIVDLTKAYRVVVAPLGVKPFSMLSMLLAARYKDIDVWRVSGEEISKPTERYPIGCLLVYRVSFGK